jgi:hypothetical protein
MVNQPTAEDRLIDRRSVLRTGAAMAAAGPALLYGAHAKAQPRLSGASPMTIIDAQVHAYAANTPQRPWHSVPNWPPHATGDEMVAAMDISGRLGGLPLAVHPRAHELGFHLRSKLSRYTDRLEFRDRSPDRAHS